VKIFLASDHAGFQLKNTLAEHVRSRGYEVEDCGPDKLEPVDDYPNLITPMAKKVAKNKGSFGIAVGMSGQGEAMAANRIKGVRAVVYYGGPNEILKLSREHNDANILSLGARFVSTEEAKAAVEHWLAVPFSNEERHLRRIQELG
jgi:ribose 5-phosphate isomerase B